METETLQTVISCEMSPRASSFHLPFCSQHNHKKIRNNVLVSGDKHYHKRLLRPLHIGEEVIAWCHWIEAFTWDQENNSFSIFQHLSGEHMRPNQREKMRNGLAEDTMGRKMLHLMQVHLLEMKLLKMKYFMTNIFI